MSRPIKEGDKVSIFWASTDEGGQTYQECLDGIVLSMPADTGDFLYIEDEHGTIHGINPCASTLEQISKKPGQ